MEMSNEEYGRLSAEADAALKPKLTDEFLAVLVQAACTHGWSGDFCATADFVHGMFALAEKECPDLQTVVTL